MTIIIKPCPNKRCGSKDVWPVKSHGGHCIACVTCGTGGPWKATSELAAEAWNEDFLREPESLAQGMRVRLNSERDWLAGEVPVGSLGTIVDRDVGYSRRILGFNIEWDDVQPRKNRHGADAFGIHGTKVPHYLDVIAGLIEREAR